VGFGGLWQRRVCTLPTWRGWVLLFVLATAVTIALARQMCAFLTVRDWVPGGVMVVEGWVPPHAAREAVEEFRRHPYLGIYVTGGPIEEGDPFVAYENYARLTAARLLEMGAPAASIHAVPAQGVAKDRTYATADALKAKLQADGIPTSRITLISIGPHSRRSRLLYEMSFGSASQIGVIGMRPQDYDPDHWWRTSKGFRTVISEFIAYGYARVLFRAN
jgi:hypothetical protein